METPSDYVDRHQRPARDQKFVEARLLKSGRVGIVRITHDGVPFGDPEGDVYLLTTPIYGSPYVEADFAGFTLKQRTYPGDFVVQHLKDGVSGFAEGAVTVQMAVFEGSWMREVVGESLDGRAPDWERAASKTFRNELISRLTDGMWERLGVEGSFGQAWADQAAILTVQTIAEHLSPESRKRRDASPLDPAQMRRFHEFVEAHLIEPIGVTEMAAAAGLSAFHFSRRFKATTGEAPHRFLVRRRLDHARKLIADNKMPLSAIALLAGFSSQAHMTTAFRARFGRTPGWFARQKK